MHIAIILPAHNEELTISQTITGFHQALEDAEIWVINNASTDETSKLAEETFLELNIKGGVIQEPLKGKANALRKAFHHINADIYVICDADLTYPTECIYELISPIQSDLADMVVGDRISSNSYKKSQQRKFHKSGNLIVRFLVNKLYKVSLSDIMSGYRAMSKKFVKTYPILIKEFEIETDMTLHALDKNFRIKEIPIHYSERPTGSFSKLSTLRDGYAVMTTIFNIARLYKPLLFYSTFGMTFIIAGILFSLPALYDWYVYSRVYRNASAILASSLEILGFIFIILGLVLDSVATHQRRQFELHLLTFNKFNTCAKE